LIKVQLNQANIG